MTKTNKSGRPKKEIDFDLVEKLCQIQCTGEEIASVLSINYDTLNNRVKEIHKVNFSDYIKRFASTGKASLRRMQWKSAEKGNTSMLIWLGKQYLDQREPERNEVVTDDKLDVIFQAAEKVISENV